MGAGDNQGELVIHKPNPQFLDQNPITQFQTKFKNLENGFKGWLSKQSLPVEAAVVTLTSAAQGAAMGGFMGTLTNDATSAFQPPPAAPGAPGFNSQAMASFQQAQALTGGPLIQARNFAVMTGVNAGISCVMRRLRGKEDVQSSMVAAFGSGVMFSLVSGMGGPNPATNVITSGVFFALIQGGLFKGPNPYRNVESGTKPAKGWHEGPDQLYLVGEKFSKPPVEDVFYSETKAMLSTLGLEGYEKNFKKGLLNDTTLPLLNDSALREVRIPPGPRLVILDHVERFKEARKAGKRK